jgi:catechol 2,3-dioxygenase-like lactoylglutathione lyase family enzyme
MASQFTAIHPKLPMRNKPKTIAYYTEVLDFEIFGVQDFGNYLMVEKDGLQLHFFLFPDLAIYQNDGQVYIRVKNIDAYYQTLLDRKVWVQPEGRLTNKPWGMREFSLLDPDHNLLTFGEDLA